MKKHLKDYFIPHAGNNFKPHSLHKVALTGMAVLVMLSFAVTNLQALLWISSDWLVSTILPAVVVELTNEKRASAAIGDLRRNVVLDQAAQLKAEHMARNQYFAHYSPDGVSPWHWFGEANYNFVHAGENLAIHFTDSSDVVTAWMNSPTHRENILNRNYQEIGIGTAEGVYEGFTTIYVVQLFGAPAATTPPPPAIVSAPTEVVSVPVVAAAETTQATVTPVVSSEPNNDSTILAEAVEISETVEITTDPVPTSTPMVTTTTEMQSAVAEVTTNDDSVVVYSDHISTSTGGVPSTLEQNSGYTATENISPIVSIATKPHQVLQFTYILLASFITACLAFAIFIEWRRQHPIQLAYSVALLLLMYGLYQVHTYLVSGVLVV